MSIDGTALERTRDIAARVIAPAAAENDRAGRWPESSIQALADAGLFVLRDSQSAAAGLVHHRSFAGALAGWKI